jgi:hypothetical protein
VVSSVGGSVVVVLVDVLVVEVVEVVDVDVEATGSWSASVRDGVTEGEFEQAATISNPQTVNHRLTRNFWTLFTEARLRSWI